MENDFEELKLAFRSKTTPSVMPISRKQERSGDALSELKKDHLKNVLTFLLTAVVIIYADKISSEKLQTSTAGFWILLLCSLYYALSRSYLLYRLAKIDPAQPVLETILELKRYRELNTFVLSYVELVYVLLLSMGVYLYLQPIVSVFANSDFPWIALLWLGYILWAGFNTLFIRRNKLKRETMILEKHIQSLSSQN